MIKKCFYLSLLYLFMLSTAGSAQTFTPVGSAYHLSGECYRLTDPVNFAAGGIWHPTPLDLSNDFDLRFSANFGDLDNTGADGIAFLLQAAGPTPLGGAGGGLGYLNPPISPSIAVEFDTWNNGGTDIATDHMAIVENGGLTHFIDHAAALGANIEDGHDHDIQITWDACRQELSVFFDGDFRGSHQQDIVAFPFLSNPMVWWGFTASTGAGVNRQTVCVDTMIFPNHRFQEVYTQLMPHVIGQRDEGYSVAQRPGGGYVSVGSSHSMLGYEQLFVVTTEEDGSPDWVRVYTDMDTSVTREGQWRSVEALANGDMILTGWAGYVNRDIIVMRIDPAGNILWSRWFGEDPNDGSYDLEICHDGSIAIVGYAGPDLFAARLDATSGAVIWSDSWGVDPLFSTCIEGFSIRQVDTDGNGIKDNGFLVAGDIYPCNDRAAADLMVAEIDWNGNLQWVNVFTNTGTDGGRSIEQIDGDGDGRPDIGQYVVGGFVQDLFGPTDSDAALWRISESGGAVTGLLHRYYDAQGSDEQAMSLELMEDGNFLLSGNADGSTNWDRDAFLMTVDVQGIATWAHRYGAAELSDWSNSAKATDCNTFVFTGASLWPNNSPDTSLYIVKAERGNPHDCNQRTLSMRQNQESARFTSKTLNQHGYFQENPIQMETYVPLWEDHSCGVAKRSNSTAAATPRVNQGIAMQLAPNPIAPHAQLTLTVDLPADLNGTVEILDLYGKQVFEQSVQGHTGVHSWTVPINGLSAGLYLVHLKSGSAHLATEKLLIQD